MTEVQHWFTVQEVAEHRRITPDLVYKLFQRHCLPGYEVDAWVKVDKASFRDHPFSRMGGLGKARDLFGDGLNQLVDELNRELVA